MHEIHAPAKKRQENKIYYFGWMQAKQHIMSDIWLYSWFRHGTPWIISTVKYLKFPVYKWLRLQCDRCMSHSHISNGGAFFVHQIQWTSFRIKYWAGLSTVTCFGSRARETVAFISSFCFEVKALVNELSISLSWMSDLLARQTSAGENANLCSTEKLIIHLLLFLLITCTCSSLQQINYIAFNIRSDLSCMSMFKFLPRIVTIELFSLFSNTTKFIFQSENWVFSATSALKKYNVTASIFIISILLRNLLLKNRMIIIRELDNITLPMTFQHTI